MKNLISRSDLVRLLKSYILHAKQSPALSGVPTAPTASPGANSTQIATTAYSDANLALAKTFVMPQCGRFNYSSATAVTFTPHNGDVIKINGALYRIPSAGIAGGANTSIFIDGTGGQNLAATTLYYVYAFLNSSTVTIDFSTTAYAVSATAGNVGTYIKTGVDTRTLIGMVRTNGSSQFVSDLVLSWFNRRNKILNLLNSSNRTTTATPWVEISSSDRLTFVSWASDPAIISYTATADQNSVQAQYAGVGVDGTTSRIGSSYGGGVAGIPEVHAGSGGLDIGEGAHYATIVGGVDGGATLTFRGNYCAISVTVHG